MVPSLFFFLPYRRLYSSSFTLLFSYFRPFFQPPPSKVLSTRSSFYLNPKRHKCLHAPAYFDGSAPFSCPKPELAMEMLTPSPDFEPPKIQSGVCNLKERGVSAQSIAARERRRKTTEKTRELGRLIPGGAKMNTAEMLQAAFKYVEYLQDQLGILQMMMNHSSLKNGQVENGKLEREILKERVLQEAQLRSFDRCVSLSSPFRLRLVGKLQPQISRFCQDLAYMKQQSFKLSSFQTQTLQKLNFLRDKDRLVRETKPKEKTNVPVQECNR